MDNVHNSGQTPWHLVLPVLRQLSSELDAGARALARQDLKEFERHVALQGELCALLADAGLFPTESRAVRPAPAPVQQIAHEIRQQKRVYASLLGRAERFVQVLLTFHQSSRGYSAKGRAPLEIVTWSSEV
ncbi:MAG TPA: hypothetical protein VLT90_01385 [Terriglobales bacterium]|nr:hypothetical protein [Terriglobales bacterium]